MFRWLQMKGKSAYVEEALLTNNNTTAVINEAASQTDIKIPFIIKFGF
jgi:hypothetical protein